jgi:CCR4-NOT transcription complex subunit 3
VSGGEVKNKQPLLDARASIERRMETFKVVERETKTKAYSKEGLARDATLTPEERRRLGTRQWVQEFVQALEDEVDATEAEVEALEAASGGKKKEREATLARLNGLITNHRWHIDRLEALTRMLDNAAVDPDAVDGIKEDLEYYQEQVRATDCLCSCGCVSDLLTVSWLSGVSACMLSWPHPGCHSHQPTPSHPSPPTRPPTAGEGGGLRARCGAVRWFRGPDARSRRGRGQLRGRG